MAEAYTHLRIARCAAAVIALPGDEKAYLLGANGPDPLFAYKVLAKRKPYPLPELGQRIHTERCGEFLLELVRRSETAAQRCYTLGFLTHYAADCAFHPYVAACTAEGGAFHRAEGHGFCEVALDTYFHMKDTGRAGVPARDAVVMPTTSELAEIPALLRGALLAVYGEDVPLLAITDAFRGFRRLHGFFYSPLGGKKALAAFADKCILRRTGWAMSHMTPACPPAGGFAEKWVDPFTGETQHAGPDALCREAEATAAALCEIALHVWNDRAPLDIAAAVIGSYSYETGQPLAHAKGEDAS